MTILGLSSPHRQTFLRYKFLPKHPLLKRSTNDNQMPYTGINNSQKCQPGRERSCRRFTWRKETIAVWIMAMTQARTSGAARGIFGKISLFSKRPTLDCERKMTSRHAKTLNGMALPAYIDREIRPRMENNLFIDYILLFILNQLLDFILFPSCHASSQK